MMRSDGAEAMQALVAGARAFRAKVVDQVLPFYGSEFEVTYFNGSDEVSKDELHQENYFKPPTKHNLVTCVTGGDGVEVTVMGHNSKVLQNRQEKPEADPPIRRSMLVIEMDGVFVHILGKRIVVARERYRAGQVARSKEVDHTDEEVY